LISINLWNHIELAGKQFDKKRIAVYSPEESKGLAATRRIELLAPPNTPPWVTRHFMTGIPKQLERSKIKSERSKMLSRHLFYTVSFDLFSMTLKFLEVYKLFISSPKNPLYTFPPPTRIPTSYFKPTLSPIVVLSVYELCHLC
jgi:hypothetical protein